MAQSKILLDTTTYLRLAQSIHPLLGQTFGEKNFTLYVHKEIEIELKRSGRLQSEFSWIERDEYIQNRKKRLKIFKEHIKLEPESTNPDNKPIILERDFQIQGVVVKPL